MDPYQLIVNRDLIRSEISEDIKNYFPKYIDFFNLVISKFIGNHHNWKEDMHPIFEEIGMTDYAIIKSLNCIRRNYTSVTQGDPNQIFKSVYLHFGLIFDDIEHMSRNILRLKSDFNLLNLPEQLKMDKKNVIDKYSKWFDDKYTLALNEYIQTGKRTFPPSNMKKSINIFLKKEPALKRKYKSISGKIRQYRNIFVHNPRVDIFVYTHREIPLEKTYHILLCPKKDTVEKYKLWSDMRLNYEKNKDDFANPISMIELDYREILSLLNNIYEYNIQEFKELFKTDMLKKYLVHYKRE